MICKHHHTNGWCSCQIIWNLDNNNTFLFNKFKENNDTHLIAHSGSCSASDCNIGVSGYTFIGNNSNTYCNIIFEQENGICTDIFKCSSFKVDDLFINKAREKKLDSYNFTDEELDDLPF